MTESSGYWEKLADLYSANTDSPLFFALLVLYLFCFLDVLTTVIIIINGGNELNPFMVSFASSPVMHLLLKWLAVFVIYLLAAGAEQKIRYSGQCIMAAAAVYYLVIVLHNLSELLTFIFA